MAFNGLIVAVINQSTKTHPSDRSNLMKLRFRIIYTPIFKILALTEFH